MKQVIETRAPSERVSRAALGVKPSGIRKFFDLVTQMDGVISLGIGEPDLDTPMEIRMEAVSALVQGQTRYTANIGLLELREAIADYVQRRTGIFYDPKAEVLVTTGVAQGIDLALRALVNPGDDVLIPEPCFVSYAPCTTMAGGRPVPVPLSAENGFRLTPEALQAAMTSQARVLLICFPNNPTGAVMGHQDLAALLPLIEQYDLTVVSDEIYSELTFDEPHTSIVTLPGMRERSLLLNGFSKTFAMTGWRLGFAAGPEPMIAALTRIHQHAMMSAPTIAQLAGVEALRRVDQVAEVARQVYNERRKILCQGFMEIGLSCVEPKAAFYAFPSIARTGFSDELFAELLLREEKVAVVPGSAFGVAGQGHIRCSYTCHKEQLEVAVERMARFVQRHR